MGLSANMEVVQNDFEKWRIKALSADNMSGALARAVYPMYQQLQMNRFQTQNASEGASWQPLNETYRKYKLRRYGGGKKRPSKKNPATEWKSWPGNGTKMLIGTGTLAGAVIGPGLQGNPFPPQGIAAHQRLITGKTMIITINESGANAENHPFVYAKYVNLKRNFMTFSDDSIAQMKQALIQFLIGKTS